MTDKIKELQKKIEGLKAKQKNSSVQSSSSPATVIDVAAELAAGVLVGVIIGLVFDNLFDSKPVFLITCIILSIIAAFRSIWKKYINNK